MKLDLFGIASLVGLILICSYLALFCKFANLVRAQLFCISVDLVKLLCCMLMLYRASFS